MYFFVFYGFISYIFPPYFTVLLKQLRGLYTSCFIFKYRQCLNKLEQEFMVAITWAKRAQETP